MYRASYELCPGLQAEYLASQGSGAISIQRCAISNFVVGIAIAPNGIAHSAEDISIHDCIILSTKSAIAVCQDQSRGVSCRNLNVTYAKYVIDCTHYGKGSGMCPSIFNAVISTVKYVFNTYSFGSGVSFDGVYCEASLSLGVLGGGRTFDGYAFNGCAFNLQWAASRPYSRHRSPPAPGWWAGQRPQPQPLPQPPLRSGPPRRLRSPRLICITRLAGGGLGWGSCSSDTRAPTPALPHERGGSPPGGRSRTSAEGG